MSVSTGGAWLGFDLGTKTGWAVLLADGSMRGCGLIDCTPGRHESPGFRFVRFRRSVREVLGAWPGCAVAFEVVRRHEGTSAAHAYGAFRSHLLELCEELAVPYLGVEVADVKRAATGKGNAPKEAVLAAARARWPEAPLATAAFDVADALWVADAGRLATAGA